MLAIQAASAFGAGILASLSPCVYPLIPVTVGFIGAQSSAGIKYRRKLLAFLLGQVVVMTALGVITVSLGETLGFTAEDPKVRRSVGILLLLFGVFALVGKLPAFFDRINAKSQKMGEGKAGSLLSAFLLGVGSALLASPCTTPILSGILALIASSQTLLSGTFLMFSYSIGFVFLFGVIGFCLLKANSLPRSGTWMNYVHKVGGILLVLAGFYYLYLGIF